MTSPPARRPAGARSWWRAVAQSTIRCAITTTIEIVTMLVSPPIVAHVLLVVLLHEIADRILE